MAIGIPLTLHFHLGVRFCFCSCIIVNLLLFFYLEFFLEMEHNSQIMLLHHIIQSAHLSQYKIHLLCSKFIWLEIIFVWVSSFIFISLVVWIVRISFSHTLYFKKKWIWIFIKSLFWGILFAYFYLQVPVSSLCFKWP